MGKVKKLYQCSRCGSVIVHDSVSLKAIPPLPEAVENLPSVWACDACVNRWRTDYCECGSGEHYMECSCGAKRTYYKLGDKLKPVVWVR